MADDTAHQNRQLAITQPSRPATAATVVVPAIIAEAGEHAARRFLEFFAATIRNRNTRIAYIHAVGRFFAWCEHHQLGQLPEIEPLHVAAYIEALGKDFEKPTVKQHLAAIRRVFDWLVSGGILAINPAHAVRGPKHVIKRGKTPVLTADQARVLIESIPITRKVERPDDGEVEEKPCLVGLRDRALIAVMTYTFGRVGAVVAMRVEDYFANGKRWWIRLHEKGGKRHEMPAHHKLETYLDEYIKAAGIEGAGKAALFRAAVPVRPLRFSLSQSPSRHRRVRLTALGPQLTEKPMSRVDAFRMVRRRAAAIGMDVKIGCHTFRATGITAYLENGGSLENAQLMAAHESPRTTKLYDRTGDEITLEEVERIKI